MRRSITTALLVVTLGALGACSSAEEPAPAPAETFESGIPEPDAAQGAALLEQLAAIDPALNEEKSVRRSRDQCMALLRVAAGELDAATALEQARQRFTADHLTDEQAQRVNDAIMAGGWCV